MENLGFILPAEIKMLLAKKNSLLDDIMKVKHMVDTYNSFVSSMNNLEVSFNISNRNRYFKLKSVQAILSI